MKTEYGLQLYSLRDISRSNLEGAIKGAAELGYKYMEFAGFFGHSAEEVKGWMDKYGVEASGTHTDLDAITPENIRETIKFHQTIGCKNLIVPGMDNSTREKLDENIAALNMAQPILADAGITLAYHNHSGEFIKTSYGAMIHEELQARTGINFEIDTFWAFNAGLDPVALVTKLKDRVKIIHLKDGIPSFETEDHRAIGRSVGEGKAPVLAVRKMALDLGILMVVESEELNPTGLEETGRCINFLRSLEN